MVGETLRQGAVAVGVGVDGCGTDDASVATRQDWRRHLEVIGAELFQRYRKRLMMPGIALEIRRDFPGLSLPDVLVRVHAGRCLLASGQDFRALREIRSGRWQRYLAERSGGGAVRRARVDRVSRWLVRGGGLMFASFCALSVLSASQGFPGVVPLVLLGLGAGVWVGLRHLMAR